MKNKLNTRLLMIVIVALLLGLGLSSNASAGNKKLMTIKKAKVLAARALVESVIGLKIRSNSLWATKPDDYNRVQSKVAAEIKGINYDTPKYDSEKDIAQVTASIRLGSIKNIIGKPIHYDDVVISRTAFATSSKQYAPLLSALRAAELDAYDEMAKLIVGQKIKSKTEVHNMILENDEVRTKVLAAIWGAEVVKYGWEGDDAFVQLRLNVKWVRDIFGQTIEYGNSNYLEVTGYGASVNDLEEQADDEQGIVKGAPIAEDFSFDLPESAGNKETKQPTTGGSQLLR